MSDYDRYSTRRNWGDWDDDNYNQWDWRYYYRNTRRNTYGSHYRYFADRAIQGERIECAIGKWKFLIDEYMKRKYGLKEEELSLIYYLASLDRAISLRDISMHPYSGKRRLTAKKKRWLVDNGYVENFIGHNMNRGVVKSFQLTMKARNIYIKYIRLIFQMDKIPLYGLGKDWSTRLEDRPDSMKRELDWYSCVIQFNKEVDRAKKRVQEINNSTEQEKKEQ